MNTPEPGAAPRLERGRHTTAAGIRDYRLAVPAAGAGPRPLLVVLHGCLQDADDIARGTGLDIATALGAVVLYPEQDPAANARRCWNWFDAAHQDGASGEPAILASMITDVMATHDIDAAAVHLVGISAGAAMAALVAVAQPRRFASLTLASGVPWRAATTVAEALSVMQRGGGAAVPTGGAMVEAMGADAHALPVTVVHGLADGVVSVRNAHDSAAQWVAVHDVLRARAGAAPLVEAPATRLEEGGRVTDVLEWRDERNVSQVTLLRIHDLGHAWSAGDASGSFTDPAGPDIRARILQRLAAARATDVAPDS